MPRTEDASLNTLVTPPYIISARQHTVTRQSSWENLCFASVPGSMIFPSPFQRRKYQKVTMYWPLAQAAVICTTTKASPYPLQLLNSCHGKIQLRHLHTAYSSYQFKRQLQTFIGPSYQKAGPWVFKCAAVKQLVFALCYLLAKMLTTGQFYRGTHVQVLKVL